MMRMRPIRASVEELLREPEERVRAHVDAEFTRLLNYVSEGEFDRGPAGEC